MKKSKKYECEDAESKKIREEVRRLKKEASKEANKRYHVVTLDWDRFRELF